MQDQDIARGTALERAAQAVAELTTATPDEDGEAYTSLDWAEFPLGLCLHRIGDTTSVGLVTEGCDAYDLLHPDEADELALALHAYASAARAAANTLVEVTA